MTFYFDVAIFTALYCVSNVIMYGSIDWLLVVKTLTYGGTIISNGWYFQVALILYILFYVSFKIAEQPQAALNLCSVSVIAFFALNIIFKQSQTLYESVLTFPLGIILASNGKLLAKITQFSSAVIASFVFVITVVGEYLLRGSLAGVLSKMLSALAFVVCILWFFHTISRTNGIVLFFNPILKWLGCRSLEIYGIQGLFLNILKNVDLVYNNLFLYGTAVVILTMIAASAIHVLITRINRRIRQL